MKTDERKSQAGDPKEKMPAALRAFIFGFRGIER